MAPKPPPERPWFTSPLLPVLLCMAGITVLLLDGLTPWQTYHRRKNWKTVKGRLVQSVQRRTKMRSTARGGNQVDYMVKRPQRRVVSKVVTRGWPLKTKKRIWTARVTYTYPTKKGRMTRVGDSPTQEFDSKNDALAYLDDRIHHGAILVWVNPKDPTQATAFLDYPSKLTLALGFIMIALSVLWLIAALLLRRVHVRQEGV